MSTKKEHGIADTTMDSLDIKEEILKKYPPKVARRRAKQIVVNKVEEAEQVPEILANTRTIPGILTMRGCAYAGCKGVVLGPTRDILQITHGPIGCGFYSWLTRRNQTRPRTTEGANFMTYAMSTDMQEEEIIFGGEKKLKKGNRRGHRALSPEGHRHILHLPRRPHRRRRPRGCPGDGGEISGCQHLRLQLRRLQGGEPVRGPPHRQQQGLLRRRGTAGSAQGRDSSASTSWGNTTSAATPSR